MTAKPTLRQTARVLDADDGQPSQQSMMNGHERAYAELAHALAALRLAEQRIVELCGTVNVLAKFRKVRAEDYAADIRAALARLDRP